MLEDACVWPFSASLSALVVVCVGGFGPLEKVTFRTPIYLDVVYHHQHSPIAPLGKAL